MKIIKGKSLSEARAYIFKEAWRMYNDNKKYGFSSYSFSEALRDSYAYNPIKSLMNNKVIKENVKHDYSRLVEQARQEGLSWE